MDGFLKSFISLFVAIDAFGALPILISLTKGLNKSEKQKLIFQASFAALSIGLLFLFGGNSIFKFLGILENDFRIAGGILLLVFALRDLAVTASHQGAPTPSRVGIVPIAMPILMGPAALATLILSAEQFGYGVTVISLLINLSLALFLFSRADWLLKRLGEDISDAFAKISSLLLAAIGIMLVRSGIQGLL